MTPNEAAQLLAVAAAFDNRKPDATAAQAWALALDQYQIEDCQQAIVNHYKSTTDWIMPAHVITAVKRLRSQRLMEHPILTPPASLDPDDPDAYTRWLEVTRKRVADGEDVAEATYDGTRQLSELRAELRSLPPVQAKPSERTAEHKARKEAARAELGPPVPIPSEPMRESEPEEAVE